MSKKFYKFRLDPKINLYPIYLKIKKIVFVSLSLYLYLIIKKLIFSIYIISIHIITRINITFITFFLDMIIIDRDLEN